MSTLVGTSLCVVPSSVGCLWVFHFLCPQRIFLVIANEGQRIDIPDGCILENRTFGFRSISCLLTLITPIFRFTFGKPKYDCPFNLYSRIYHLLIAFSLGAVVPSFSFVVDVSSCESNLIKIAFYLSCAISCNHGTALVNLSYPILSWTVTCPINCHRLACSEVDTWATTYRISFFQRWCFLDPIPIRQNAQNCWRITRIYYGPALLFFDMTGSVNFAWLIGPDLSSNIQDRQPCQELFFWTRPFRVSRVSTSSHKFWL